MFDLVGSDPFVHDTRGDLQVTLAGLEERDRMLFQDACDQHLPVGLTMAGRDVSNIPDIVGLQLRTVILAREKLAGGT